MKEFYSVFFLTVLAGFGFCYLFLTVMPRPVEARVTVRNTQMPRLNSKGFTLMEFMVVIAMIGILTSVCYPTMKNWKETNKINSSAMDIKNILEMAKSQAIKSQSLIAVSFAAGEGNAGSYRAYTDTTGEPEKFDADDQLYKSGSVKKDVTLYDAAFDGDKADTVRFNPMGLATESSGELKLRNKKGDIFKKILVTPGGLIRIESSSTGNDGSWSD